MNRVIAMLTTQPGQRAKVLEAFNTNAVVGAAEHAHHAACRRYGRLDIAPVSFHLFDR